MELPRIISSIFAEPEEKKRRLDICQKCEFLRTSLGKKTCGICGCFLDVKAGLINHHCPLAKRKW